MYNKFVNLWQSAEERQQKYWLVKALGCNTSWAKKMRDWRLSKIERLFHLQFDEHYRNSPVFKPYAQFLLPGFTLEPHGPKTREHDPL